MSGDKDDVYFFPMIHSPRSTNNNTTTTKMAASSSTTPKTAITTDTRWYNEGSNNNSQPTGEPLYDGTQNDWVFEEINLSDYLGEQILVRFQFRSDNAVNEDGFYFDDLTINILEDGTIGIDDFENSAFNIYPNPVQNVLNITTALTNYSIEIYTIQGQLIQNKTNISASSSIDYSQYADGIYLMKLSSESNSKTFKIVKQ